MLAVEPRSAEEGAAAGVRGGQPAFHAGVGRRSRAAAGRSGDGAIAETDGSAVRADARGVRAARAGRTGMTEALARAAAVRRRAVPGRRVRALVRARDVRAGRRRGRPARDSRRSSRRTSRARRGRRTRWPSLWPCGWRPRDDVAGWVALDERVDAMKAVPELRAASRQMGRQTLRVAATLGPDAFLTAVERAAVDGLTPGHHPVAFGAALGRAGVGARARGRRVSLLDGGAARRRGAAAHRAGAARRPARARRDAAAHRAAGRARRRLASAEEMWSFNPGLELAAIRHATLDARLFRS